MEYSDRIVHAYFYAKSYVIKGGYANEIDWMNSVDVDGLTESRFLEEFTWVVLASGMSDRVVSSVFPKIKKVLNNFEDLDKISKKRQKYLDQALKIFNHQGKINAILATIEYTHNYGFQNVKSCIKSDGLDFIQTFPYMGVATSRHLAKNIGISLVKPDRHLLRISAALGFNEPQDLCQQISHKIQEDISTIDLVLWRYATLDRNYLDKIERLNRIHDYTTLHTKLIN